MVITPVSDTPVLSHPDQTVWTVIELLLSRQTFPIPVAIGGIGYHLGLGLAWILLIYLLALHHGDHRGCHGCKRGRRAKMQIHLL